MTTAHDKFRVLAFIGLAKDLERTMERHLSKEKNGVMPSCISCEYFDENTEICDAYKARPPARIIAFACTSYRDKDNIPF